MYGSSFCIVVEYPLACSNLASEAEIIPFPREDVTPPVTKIYFYEVTSGGKVTRFLLPMM